MDCSLPWDPSIHGILQGKYTGVSSPSLLQQIFPAQNQTQVSHTASRFLPSAAKGSPKIVDIIYQTDINQKSMTVFHKCLQDLKSVFTYEYYISLPEYIADGM